jgi:hypothetical protein
MRTKNGERSIIRRKDKIKKIKERERERDRERERERERYSHNKLCGRKTETEGGNISKCNHRLRSGLLQTKRLITPFAPITHAEREGEREREIS